MKDYDKNKELSNQKNWDAIETASKWFLVS